MRSPSQPASGEEKEGEGGRGSGFDIGIGDLRLGISTAEESHRPAPGVFDNRQSHHFAGIDVLCPIARDIARMSEPLAEHERPDAAADCPRPAFSSAA